jgi:sugar phosphate isomerase/epimerase
MDPVSRRQFLERTAGAAAAAAVAGWPAAGLAAQRTMFISLNGAVAPRVGPWPEKARLAARIGYGGVDWDFGPAKAAGADATKALFEALKIRPTIVNLPMQPLAGDDDAFNEKLPQLAEDAAFAAAIGCDRMMMVLSPTSGLPKDEERDLVVRRLGAVSGVLKAHDLRLGLEFLGPLYMRMAVPAPAPGGGPVGAPPRTGGAPMAPGGAARGGGRGQGRGPRIPFIWTLPETVALARDCGPNIGAILDVWHWHHSEGTIADILATDVDRIVHVHLSDAKPMPPEDVRDNMRLMPGEGTIDLVGFLQALRKIGYGGGVSPEPLGRIPQDMTAEEAATLGFETTSAVMKKAGVL